MRSVWDEGPDAVRSLCGDRSFSHGCRSVSVWFFVCVYYADIYIHVQIYIQIQKKKEACAPPIGRLGTPTAFVVLPATRQCVVLTKPEPLGVCEARLCALDWRERQQSVILRIVVVLSDGFHSSFWRGARRCECVVSALHPTHSFKQ